jgi:hypothetical protein
LRREKKKFFSGMFSGMIPDFGIAKRHTIPGMNVNVNVNVNENVGVGVGTNIENGWSIHVQSRFTDGGVPDRLEVARYAVEPGGIARIEYNPADQTLHLAHSLLPSTATQPPRPDQHNASIDLQVDSSRGVSVTATNGDHHAPSRKNQMCFRATVLPDGLQWSRLGTESAPPYHYAISPSRPMSLGEFDRLWRSIQWTPCNMSARGDAKSAILRPGRQVDEVLLDSIRDIILAELTEADVFPLPFLRLCATLADLNTITQLSESSWWFDAVHVLLIIFSRTSFSLRCLEESDVDVDDALYDLRDDCQRLATELLSRHSFFRASFLRESAEITKSRPTLFPNQQADATLLK